MSPEHLSYSFSEQGPAVWWGAGGLGVLIHRLGPRRELLVSPATGDGTRGYPPGERRGVEVGVEVTAKRWSGAPAKAGKGSRESAFPYCPWEGEPHLWYWALCGWHRWAEPGKPGRPSPCPHLVPAQALVLHWGLRSEDDSTPRSRVRVVLSRLTRTKLQRLPMASSRRFQTLISSLRFSLTMYR